MGKGRSRSPATAARAYSAALPTPHSIQPAGRQALGISSVFEHGHSAWDRHACKFVDAEWIKQGHKALGYDAEPPPETRSLYGSSDNRAAGGGAYIGGRLDARTDYVRARDYQTRYAENKYSAYPSAAGVERRGGYGYDRYGP